MSLFSSISNHHSAEEIAGQYAIALAKPRDLTNRLIAKNNGDAV